MNKYLLFGLVIIIAVFLRFYKLDQVPSALNWDEVAAAYNAYSIANFGKDEYGQPFPLIFRSFLDDKHPVHIYITAIFVKIFGVSDFVVRSSAATFGVLSVVALFLLTLVLFRKFYLALLASFFLAISPYNIHFSRGLWETNFALFFFLFGFFCIFAVVNPKIIMTNFKNLKASSWRNIFQNERVQKNFQTSNLSQIDPENDRRGWFIILGYIFFGISLLAYHSSKIIVPPIVILITLLYFKNLQKFRQYFYIGMFIFLCFISLLIIEPRLLGLARIQQTKVSEEKLMETNAYKITKNPILAQLEIGLKRYPLHFSNDYLFIKGDQNPRNSSKNFGMFHKVDLLFLIIGFGVLLWMRSRVTLILLSWFLLAPLPSSLVEGAPNATRSLYIMGVWQLIAAFGFYYLLRIFKNVRFRLLVLTIFLLALGLSLRTYLIDYYTNFPNRDIHDWQYGMKQIVEFVKNHPEYTRVYMTDVRSQPYIFFLYYLRVSPDELQKTVIYNDDIRNRSYNLIYSFDRYQFGGWDEIHSMPDPNILYIIEEGKYNGLAHLKSFGINKAVKFPDGSTAFYIISAP